METSFIHKQFTAKRNGSDHSAYKLDSTESKNFNHRYF